jgi:hypothetical protein
MNITEEQPAPEYVLRMGYVDLHSLYHMMLDLSRSTFLGASEEAFFRALKEHA